MLQPQHTKDLLELFEGFEDGFLCDLLLFFLDDLVERDDGIMTDDYNEMYADEQTNIKKGHLCGEFKDIYVVTGGRRDVSLVWKLKKIISTKLSHLKRYYK